jgi:peptidoglycan/LPS O-acetylase OafA/YrhL
VPRVIARHITSLYACFPLLVVGLARIRSARGFVVVGSVIVAIMVVITAWFVATGRADLPWTDAQSAHRWLYRAPLLRLGDFTLGVLAARLYLRLRDRPRVVKSGGPLALTAALVIVALMAWPSHVYSAWSWDISFAIPALVLIFGLAAAPRGLLARLMSVPIIVLLGEASYAFYLIHWVMIRDLHTGGWSRGLSAATVLREAMVLGLVVCVAVGLHMLVERPARDAIRRFGQRPRRAHKRRSNEPSTTPARDNGEFASAPAVRASWKAPGRARSRP